MLGRVLDGRACMSRERVVLPPLARYAGVRVHLYVC